MNNDLFLNEFPEVEVGAVSQPQTSTTMLKHQPISYNANDTNYLGVVGIVVGALILLFILFSVLKKRPKVEPQNYSEEYKPAKRTIPTRSKIKKDSLSVPETTEDCIMDFLDRTK